MDAVKFLEEYDRMTATDVASTREYFETCENNEQRASYIELWSKAHPCKTRLQDFLEKYPYAEIDHDENRPFSTCAARLGYLEMDDCPNDCSKCWNAPLD